MREESRVRNHLDQGYYNTPNKMVPLQDREPGEIATVALEQLRAYQRCADNWPMREMLRHDDRLGVTRTCMCCAFDECIECIWFVKDVNDNPYTYTDDELRALKVAHIRQVHDGK